MRVQSNWLLNQGDELGTVLGYRLFLNPNQLKTYKELKFSLVKDYQVALGTVGANLIIFSLTKEKTIDDLVMDKIIHYISQNINLTLFGTIEFEKYNIDLTRLPWGFCVSLLRQALVSTLIVMKEKNLVIPLNLNPMHCTNNDFRSDDHTIRYETVLGFHSLGAQNFYVALEIRSRRIDESTGKSNLYSLTQMREHQKLCSSERLRLIQCYATHLFHPRLDFHLGGCHLALTNRLVVQDLTIEEVSL